MKRSTTYNTDAILDHVQGNVLTIGRIIPLRVIDFLTILNIVYLIIQKKDIDILMPM